MANYFFLSSLFLNFGWELLDLFKPINNTKSNLDYYCKAKLSRLTDFNSNYSTRSLLLNA